jgi:hypothetical protein
MRCPQGAIVMNSADDNAVLVRALITQVRVLEAQIIELQAARGTPIAATASKPAAAIEPPKPATVIEAHKAAPTVEPIKQPVSTPVKTVPAPVKDTPKQETLEDFKAYLASWSSPSTKPVKTAEILAYCRSRFAFLHDNADSTLKAKIQGVLSARVKKGEIGGSTAGYWSLDAKAPVKPKPTVQRLPKMTPEELVVLESKATEWVSEWFKSNKEGTHKAISKEGAEALEVPNGSKWAEMTLKALHSLRAAGTIGSEIGRGFFVIEAPAIP